MTADPAKLRAATTYNAAADHFDDEPLAFWARLGRRTIERLAPPPGARILDIGCGTGASALPAAEAVGLAGRVIGVDLAERLLEIARRKAERLRLSNVELVAADMEHLAYPNGHFDAIVSVFSLFFVPDMVAVLRDLWRMLRPGGRLAVTSWGARMFEPGTSAWWSAVREERADLVPTVSPWDRIATPEKMRALLREAGIEGAEIVAEDSVQPLPSPEDWWSIVLGSGFRWTVEQLGPEAAARVRAVNLATLRRADVTAVETNALFAIAQKPR
jgi:ubiquinone/menaquinone biosynthesis C-methylase UbiE